MSVETTTTCPNGEDCPLNDEVAKLRVEVNRLLELVSTDPLTGLFNYRHFSHSLEQEIERSRRTHQPTSLIMLDVDHFKGVNDQWGHEVGNQALKMIASCITQNIRKLDIACRYGGEEFAIILPSSSVGTSARVAERIRKSIEQSPLTFTQANGEAATIQLTASAGLSAYSGNREYQENSLVSAADEQLYLAKRNGRNQICFVAPDTSAQQVSTDEKSALFTIFDDNNEDNTSDQKKTFNE